MADSDLACGGMSYGKRIPKLAKLSPDGWFQVCDYICTVVCTHMLSHLYTYV